MTSVRFLVGFEPDLLEWMDGVCGAGGRGKFLAGLARAERARRGEGPVEGAVASPDRPMDLQERIVRAAGRQRFTEKALAKRLGVDEREVEKVVRLMVQSGLLVRFGDLVGIPEKLRGAV